MLILKKQAVRMTDEYKFEKMRILRCNDSK